MTASFGVGCCEPDRPGSAGRGCSRRCRVVSSERARSQRRRRSRNSRLRSFSAAFFRCCASGWSQREGHRSIDHHASVHASKPVELTDTASQALDARLDLDHVARIDRSSEPTRSIPLNNGIRPRFSGFDRIRIAPTCAMHSVRIVGGKRRAFTGLMGQIALVEGDVLDPDDPLVRLQLGDAIDQQKRIAMRQGCAR